MIVVITPTQCVDEIPARVIFFLIAENFFFFCYLDYKNFLMNNKNLGAASAMDKLVTMELFSLNTGSLSTSSSTRVSSPQHKIRSNSIPSVLTLDNPPHVYLLRHLWA